MDINSIGKSFDINATQSKKNKIYDDKFQQTLEKAYSKGDQEQLKKACDDFESVFLNMMYKQMRATVQKSELLPTDSGREIFESMLDEKLMEGVSKSGGVGLSKMLYSQLGKQMNNSYTPKSVSQAVIKSNK